jgi:2,3-bisphosphoglycerate-dependent phosphoglycerate mutase
LTREGGIDMKKLMLLRHGKSIWDKQARFTGWADVDLTPKCIKKTTQAVADQLKQKTSKYGKIKKLR